jgi:hypothetical protein
VISITAFERAVVYLEDIVLIEEGGSSIVMEKDSNVMKFLKWAGLLALVSLPLVVFLKKRKPEISDSAGEDDSNIFAAELEE